MSGLASAAAADLSLTSTNFTLVVVVAAIAVIAGHGGLLPSAGSGRRPRHREDAEIGAAVEEARRPTWRQFKTLSVFVVLGLLPPAPAAGPGLGRQARSGFFVSAPCSRPPSATSA